MCRHFVHSWDLDEGGHAVCDKCARLPYVDRCELKADALASSAASAHARAYSPTTSAASVATGHSTQGGGGAAMAARDVQEF